MGRMSSTKEGNSAGKIRRIEAQSWAEEGERNDYVEKPVHEGSSDIEERIIWDEV